ncbi:hypothetical protein [Agromyces sp. NPDC049794]|uniref:hypothetical protein n=1 Tax=unclassified Agromyces TaxID=2639701 RepID=UPI0033D8FC87
MAEQSESVPVEEPAPAPVEEPAPAPVEEPTPAPVEEPAASPAVEAAVPAEAPVDAAAAEAALPAAEVEAPVVALLVPPGEEVVDKVEICHATASYRNPYVINEPAADGDVSGHADHTGPIFYPEIEEQWGDIIPPFYYDDGGEEPAYFPGLNWDAEGQAIYENDCVMPTVVPDLMITVTSCIDFYGPDGEIEWTLGPLQANLDYRVIIWDSEDNDVATWTFSGTAGPVNGSASLPPGDYTITVEQSTIGDGWELIDEQSFTIDECPVLDVDAVATGCSFGDDGTALVSLSGLVVGEDYDWSLVGGDVLIEDTLTAPSESLDVPFGDLPPGMYTFTITWTEDEDVTATATFTVEECVSELDVTAAATGCSLGDDGTALVSLFGLIVDEDYDWSLAGGDVLIEDTLTAPSESLDVPFGDLPPGTYTFTITWTEHEDVTAMAEFVVEPCQPVISVVVTECPAYGEEGSALVRLSDLVEGVEYDVWVTASGDMNGTAYDGIRTITAGASHMAEIEFAPLPPGMDYTAWVHGVWADEDDEFELHASVDFTLEPCPAKPAKPAKHDKPAKPVKPSGGLADTGVNDPTGPIAAALLLLGLGGAALIARARREGRTNHSE